MDIKQINDNPELLNIILDDYSYADNLYKATGYYNTIQNQFLSKIIESGLYNFRRRPEAHLRTVGGADISLYKGIDLYKYNFLNNFIFKNRITNKIISLLNMLFNSLPIDLSYKDDIFNLYYNYCLLIGEKYVAKSIEEFSSSLIGNPKEVFNINNKYYTIFDFIYYIRYAYTCQFINYKNINIIVDLGCGIGR